MRNKLKYFTIPDQSNIKVYKLTDYWFWITLILYTDPGGILELINRGFAADRILIKDILFFVLSILYIVLNKEYNQFDAEFIKAKKYLLLFVIYYFIAFSYIIPILNNNTEYSFFTTMIKSRWTLYRVFLFIYIYEYFKRSWEIFIKVFLFSSIIILTIFILSIITRVSILPVEVINRGFVNINRNMMVSYGIMPLLIPLGAMIVIFKSKIYYKTFFLVGFILMSMTWLVSLTRRHIIGIIIYFIIAVLFNAFIKNQYKMLVFNTVKISLLVFFLIIISYFAFPRYINAAKIAIIESIIILDSGKTTTGKKELRMTLEKPFINEQFNEHPVWGTGFDNRWRTGAGDREGYEASDFPFLAAMAMYGVLGVTTFLPIYILLIRNIKKDIALLRVDVLSETNTLFVIFLTFILYFLFHLLQYFNYFEAISVTSNFIWYISLSLYLASRSQFYKSRYVNSFT